jgi:XTP/dITP diphosphohydrolase
MIAADGRAILATRSVGQLRELVPMFADAGIPLDSLQSLGIPEGPEEDAIEAFETFEENALAKARYFARLTGRAAIADDSGLEVVALGGRPGVRSKRWSERLDLTGVALDEANNARLLAEVRDTLDRRARYVCVAAYSGPRGERTARGIVEGRIVVEPRGTGGFGYDPYFEATELGCTFGEATLEAKGRISHRGRAFAELIEWLRSIEPQRARAATRRL